jgi:hypothetical protein
LPRRAASRDRDVHRQYAEVPGGRVRPRHCREFDKQRERRDESAQQHRASQSTSLHPQPKRRPNRDQCEQRLRADPNQMQMPQVVISIKLGVLQRKKWA